MGFPLGFPPMSAAFDHDAGVREVVETVRLKKREVLRALGAGLEPDVQKPEIETLFQDQGRYRGWHDDVHDGGLLGKASEIFKGGVGVHGRAPGVHGEDPVSLSFQIAINDVAVLRRVVGRAHDRHRGEWLAEKGSDVFDHP